jgi:hypothetical protein
MFKYNFNFLKMSIIKKKGRCFPFLSSPLILSIQMKTIQGVFHRLHGV